MFEQDPNKVKPTVATGSGSVIPAPVPVLTPPPSEQSSGSVSSTPVIGGGMDLAHKNQMLQNQYKAVNPVAVGGNALPSAPKADNSVAPPTPVITTPTVAFETPDQKAKTQAAQAQISQPGGTAYTPPKNPDGATIAPPKDGQPATAGSIGIQGKYDASNPETKAQTDTMYNMIDPTGSLAPQAQKDIKDAIASGDESKIQTIANVYGMDLQHTKDFIQAYRATRDASLTDNYSNQANDRQNAQIKQQYDTAIDQQKNRIEANANNMGVVSDTAGRLQSRNMANAILTQMNEQQRILDNLYQSKDWALAEVASNAKYNHDVLSNAYNDAMSAFDKQVQEQIKNLSDTGMAKTAEGLRMAQSAIEQSQLKKLQAGYQYATGLKQAVEVVKMQIEQKKPDTDQTNLYNDGYLHNVNGDVVMGKNGEPIKSNPKKKVDTTSTNNNGDLFIHYDDGTSEIASGVGKKDISKVTSTHTDTNGNVTQIIQDPITGKYTTQTFNGIDKKEPPNVVSTQVDGDGNVTTILQDPITGVMSTQTFKGIAKGLSEKYTLKDIKDADGNITGFYAINTQNINDYKIIGTGGASGTGSPVNAQAVASYSIAQRGTSNLQCGELVNDYWKQATGERAGMNDSLQSKIDTIEKIGQSANPVEGGLFVSNPGGNDTGHTGVVQSVNPDGSITILEANRKGGAKGSPPELSTIKDTSGMIFSKAPAGSNGDMSGVLSTILGSGKFTKDQTKAIKNAVNNGEDPFMVVKNQAKGLMGQTEATKVTNFEISKNTLQELNNTLKQFYAEGGKTNIFSGNIEKTINNLGEVDDPKLVELATEIQSALQIYRNAVSGTAYSVQEGADIASIFPGINKSEGLNQAIINGRLRAFDSTIDGSYKAVLGDAYTKLRDQEKSKQDEADSAVVKNSLNATAGVSNMPSGADLSKENVDRIMLKDEFSKFLNKK